MADKKFLGVNRSIYHLTSMPACATLVFLSTLNIIPTPTPSYFSFILWLIIWIIPDLYPPIFFLIKSKEFVKVVNNDYHPLPAGESPSAGEDHQQAVRYGVTCSIAGIITIWNIARCWRWLVWVNILKDLGFFDPSGGFDNAFNWIFMVFLACLLSIFAAVLEFCAGTGVYRAAKAMYNANIWRWRRCVRSADVDLESASGLVEVEGAKGENEGAKGENEGEDDGKKDGNKAQDVAQSSS